MADYENLKVFHRAHALCLTIYRVTRDFPADERFGLVSQLRRAASSVPANIVESSKVQSDKNTARYIGIAVGSMDEVIYFIKLSCDLKYVTSETGNRLTKESKEIVKMLAGFKRSLTTGNRRLATD